MGDKRRDLPSWMTEGHTKPSDQGEFGKNVQTRGGKKRTRVQREMLYFMNEAELVDAAFRVLNEGSGENRGTGTRALQTEAEENTRGKPLKSNGDPIRRKKLLCQSDAESESSDCELSKKTYISETDPEDLAEKATLPYAAQEPGDRGVPGELVRDAVESVFPTSRGVVPELDQGNLSPPAASEDDSLRLVREIFFK